MCVCMCVYLSVCVRVSVCVCIPTPATFCMAGQGRDASVGVLPPVTVTAGRRWGAAAPAAPENQLHKLGPGVTLWHCRSRPLSRLRFPRVPGPRAIHCTAHAKSHQKASSPFMPRLSEIVGAKNCSRNLRLLIILSALIPPC